MISQFQIVAPSLLASLEAKRDTYARIAMLNINSFKSLKIIAFIKEFTYFAHDEFPSSGSR